MVIIILIISAILVAFGLHYVFSPKVVNDIISNVTSNVTSGNRTLAEGAEIAGEFIEQDIITKFFSFSWDIVNILGKAIMWIFEYLAKVLFNIDIDLPGWFAFLLLGLLFIYLFYKRGTRIFGWFMKHGMLVIVISACLVLLTFILIMTGAI